MARRALRKTHDLAELGVQCGALDSSIANLVKRSERLTVFAWIFRYPGHAEEPPLQEAQEWLELAAEVLAAVLDRPPNDAQP